MLYLQHLTNLSARVGSDISRDLRTDAARSFLFKTLYRVKVMRIVWGLLLIWGVSIAALYALLRGELRDLREAGKRDARSSSDKHAPS